MVVLGCAVVLALQVGRNSMLVCTKVQVWQNSRNQFGRSSAAGCSVRLAWSGWVTDALSCPVVTLVGTGYWHVRGTNLDPVIGGKPAVAGAAVDRPGLDGSLVARDRWGLTVSAASSTLCP